MVAGCADGVSTADAAGRFFTSALAVDVGFGSASIATALSVGAAGVVAIAGEGSGLSAETTIEVAGGVDVGTAASWEDFDATATTIAPIPTTAPIPANAGQRGFFCARLFVLPVDANAVF